MEISFNKMFVKSCQVHCEVILENVHFSDLHIGPLRLETSYQQLLGFFLGLPKPTLFHSGYIIYLFLWRHPIFNFHDFHCEPVFRQDNKLSYPQLRFGSGLPVASRPFVNDFFQSRLNFGLEKLGHFQADNENHHQKQKHKTVDQILYWYCWCKKSCTSW